jgi:hypothetical protein
VTRTVTAKLEQKLKTWNCAGNGQLGLWSATSPALEEDREVSPDCPACTYEVTRYVGRDFDQGADDWECQLCGHVFPVVTR